MSSTTYPLQRSSATSAFWVEAKHCRIRCGFKQRTDLSDCWSQSRAAALPARRRLNHGVFTPWRCNLGPLKPIAPEVATLRPGSMPTKRRRPEAGFPTQPALQQVYGRTLASALSCPHSGAGVWILVPLPSRA